MKNSRGFTLIELMIVVAIIAVLSAIALPAYNAYTIKASREAAQTELLQMAALQEKIYLNGNSYSVAAGNIITDAYTGQPTGGLGWAATSKDKKYNFECLVANCTANSFLITAIPVNNQAADGNLTVNSVGRRQWFKNGGAATPW